MPHTTGLLRDRVRVPGCCAERAQPARRRDFESSNASPSTGLRNRLRASYQLQVRCAASGGSTVGVNVRSIGRGAVWTAGVSIAVLTAALVALARLATQDAALSAQ